MNKDPKQESENNKSKTGFNGAVAVGASSDTVQRHGAAIKEHIVGYSGTDKETGEIRSKSLKGISQSKTNSETYNQNIKQQAGFSAEVKAEAKENAERAVQGKTTHRIKRTDDMQHQPDGKGGMIGGTNDQLYDLAEVDKNGIFIQGTGRQLKFVGGSPKECADKLLNKKFDKYRNADIEIEVPSDFYDGVDSELAKKAESLNRQKISAEKSGNTELARKKQEQLDRVNQTRKNLRKSSVSNKEAIEARTHPKLSTAKDIGKLSVRAGADAAKNAALFTGSISIVKNIVSYYKGDEDANEAILNVAKDTGSSATLAFSTASFGSVIKGYFQNSDSTALRSVSKSSLPSAAVTLAINTAKVMTQYFKGEISGVECFENLGREGTGMLATAFGFTVGTAVGEKIGAVIGQTVIPIPIVGGIFGGIIGYTISSACYGIILDALKDQHRAEQERIVIEQVCNEHIKLLREYRKDLDDKISTHISEELQTFNKAFLNIKSALNIGDIDGIIKGANEITKSCGKQVPFETMDEVDALMSSDIIFKL